MAAPLTHRSTTSISQTHLAPPTAGQSPKPRRMTSPSLPPPSPLNLPEPVTYGGHRRPPSPLRNAVTADPFTGDISDDGSFDQSEDSAEHTQWGQRSGSPSPSVAKFAANFAQKVGSLVSNMGSRSQTHLPTDEELEAEAERERDRTRLEAEWILSREAETKRLEGRVLAMLEGDMKNLPPPTLPSTPPSPAGSNKEGGWLSAVKSRLTPTKEPLTPAQQIILDTKARDKEQEKEEKKLEKERKEIEKEIKKVSKKQSKQRSGEWSSSPEVKYADPALQQQEASVQAQVRHHPIHASSSSPTPVRQSTYSTPPSLAPSPRRSGDTISSSPSRQGPPVYAQFSPEGTLDIPSTLLTIATRFEKLERWTVGHVRALEERMDDVERWLVEKEKEPEQSTSTGIKRHQTGEPASVDAAIVELRDELTEVQGRIGELGREMAKMVTAPGNLSSGPSRSSASVARAPSASSSIAVRTMSSSFVSTPRTSTPPKLQDSTSPSTKPSSGPSSSVRTRLPYPTGDYATPPDTVQIAQGPFSPTNSPPSSVNTRTRQTRHVSISGLPSPDLEQAFTGNLSFGLPSRATSPPSLPRPPGFSDLRPSSVSPTPRKRYTVALNAPIMSASDHDNDGPTTTRSRSNSRDRQFSASPISTSISLDTSDDSDSGAYDETIGKSAARRSALTIPDFKGHKTDEEPGRSLSPSPRISRARPQSMYSRSSALSLAAPAPVTPLHTRLRSHSTDRFGLALNDSESGMAVPTTPTSGKFVDPLVTRRQTKEALANTVPTAPRVMPGKPKVPVGQLVAYFNQEK